MNGGVSLNVYVPYLILIPLYVSTHNLPIIINVCTDSSWSTSIAMYASIFSTDKSIIMIELVNVQQVIKTAEIQQYKGKSI